MKVKVDTCTNCHIGNEHLHNNDFEMLTDICNNCDRFVYGTFIQYISSFWKGSKAVVLVDGKLKEYDIDRVVFIDERM